MGPIGPMGPMGLAGPIGPAGPSSVVASYFATGGETVVPSAATQFLSPTVSVTIADGQSVFVNSTRALGSNSTFGAAGLSLWICHQASWALTPMRVGPGLLAMQVGQNQRVPFSLSGVLSGLPAGTYVIGLCGTGSSGWNSNAGGYTTALVF